MSAGTGSQFLSTIDEKPPKKERPSSAKQEADRSLKRPSYRPISASRNLPHTKSGSLPRTKSSRQNSGSRSLARLRPRHISMDKEQLYEETLSLKMEVNFFKEQNIRLKTKLQQTEKELVRKEDFLDDIQMNSREKSTGSNLHLISNLKHTIRDLKMELKQREDDIDKLRKDTKVSRVNELEVELQVYIDECTRLRHHIEEVMMQLHQRSASMKDISKIEEIMKTLTAQKQALETALGGSQEELRRARETITALEAKLKTANQAEVHSLKAEVRKLKHQLEQHEESSKRWKNLDSEAQTLKRELADRSDKLQKVQQEKTGLEEEVKKLRQQLQDKAQKPQPPSGPIIDDSKYEISVKEEVKVENSFDDARAIIEEIEKSTRNSTKAFAAKCLSTLANAPKSAKRQVSKLLAASHPSPDQLFTALSEAGVRTSIEEVATHLEHLGECLLPGLPSAQSSPHSSYSSNYEEDEEAEGNTSPVKARKPEPIPLQSSKPLAADPTLKAISYRLQLHRIPKAKLGPALFGKEFQVEARVNMEDVQEILSNPPFNIRDEEECKQIAMVMLDGNRDDRGETMKDVVSRLFRTFDDWEVLSDEEEAHFDQHISQVLTRQKFEFLDHCQNRDPDHRGEISLPELLEVFTAMGLHFDSRELHYMELLFFSLNFQLNQVPYEKFVEAYAADDSQGDTSRSEMALTDEERRAIVKQYLEKIATQLLSKSLNLSQVFRSKDGYLYPDKFIQGMRTLGIPDMKKEELVAFLDALQCEDLDEYGIEMQLFSDIIEGYRAKPGEQPGDKSLVELGSSSGSRSADEHSF